LSDENLNEFISFLSKPQINKLITDHGDMDHPSVIFQKLLSTGDKLQLIKLLGVAFKTFF